MRGEEVSLSEQQKDHASKASIMSSSKRNVGWGIKKET